MTLKADRPWTHADWEAKQDVRLQLAVRSLAEIWVDEDLEFLRYFAMAKNLAMPLCSPAEREALVKANLPAALDYVLKRQR